jgi:hypothetical protein
MHRPSNFRFASAAPTAGAGGEESTRGKKSAPVTEVSAARRAGEKTADVDFRRRYIRTIGARRASL